VTRVAYVNGRYVPHRRAAIHIEDRGYQFADGVYEVIAVFEGRLIDEAGHLDRLDRSLRELRMAWPTSRDALRVIMRETIRRNRVGQGSVYLQITRGVAPRDHAFPERARSALVVTARPKDLAQLLAGDPVAVITLPDMRWKRPDIKTVSLLPNCLAKQQAREAGVYEAWLVDDTGHVTEGTSSNAWIVAAHGELVTRSADRAILNGITRLSVLTLAREKGLRLSERPFTVAEAKDAREAFLTGTTSFVKPVVRIDDHPVADGAIGPLSRRLCGLYAAHFQRPDEGHEA
jgi:D-alanine transaminase